VILLSVSITLLLLRYNCIPLHQSLNFIWSLLNHSESRTILLDIIACLFMFIIDAGTGVVNISISDHLYSSEALFMICKDSSCSDNISILSVLLELILAPLCSLHYICFIHYLAVTLPSFVCEIFYYTSLAR